MLQMTRWHRYLTLQRSVTVQREQYIDERHRHRYEVNPDLVDQLEQHGLRFVGKDETVPNLNPLPSQWQTALCFPGKATSGQ